VICLVVFVDENEVSSVVGAWFLRVVKLGELLLPAGIWKHMTDFGTVVTSFDRASVINPVYSGCEVMAFCQM